MSQDRRGTETATVFGSPGWLLGVLLVLTFLGGAASLWKSFQLLSHQGDNTYPESTVVQIGLWAAQSGRLYPSLEQSPFTPAPYAPLLYLSVAGLARLGWWDFLDLLRAGRLMVLVCFVILVLLAYRWSRRAGMPATVALLSSSFLLSQADFQEWNVSVRGDVVALLLTLLALYTVNRSQTPKVTGAGWAGLCLGLALMFKQSYIAAPIAIGLWLLSYRRFRQFAGLVAGAALPVVATLGWLWLRGEPVLQQMLMFRSSTMRLSSGLALLKNDFLQYPAQAVLLCLALLGLRVAFAECPVRARLLGLYFLLAWGTGVYTATAPGASVNAFLEGWLVCALLATFGVRNMAEGWSSASETLRAAVLLLLLCLLGLGLDTWRQQVAVGRPKGWAELAAALKGRELLSDLSYLAIQARNPELLDPSVNHYLELAGNWSPEPVLARLEARKYDFVVLGLNRGRVQQWRGVTLFSRPILRKIEEHYEVSCLTPRLAVLIPRDDPRGSAGTLLRLVQAGCSPARAISPTQSVFSGTE